MSSLLLRRALPRASTRAFSTSANRSSFAKMTIIGRLADTPELQPTSTGEELLRYAVGVNSGPKDNQKTSWFRVTSFAPEGPLRSLVAGLEKGYVCFLSFACGLDVCYGGKYEGWEGVWRRGCGMRGGRSHCEFC